MQQQTTATAPCTIAQEKIIKVTYTNWRGETGERTIIPIALIWDSTEWHPEPQWLLKCYDVDRVAERLYALKDIKEFHS